MELIVAVYDDWGIGCCGTQPIALSADRKFFRETTRGAMVIAGRKTIGDFPGQKPLPGRVNVALTRTVQEIPGFTVCAVRPTCCGSPIGIFSTLRWISAIPPMRASPEPSKSSMP